LLPDNVVTTWGMTETGSGVIYDAIPLPGVDVASLNGELCVRTPTLFRSYRQSPRPSVVGPDGHDNWFPTGDAADVREGRVHVLGRLGFVINTGGEKLWPEDLETVLSSISGVSDVAVTAADDPEWGQRVIALVVSDGKNHDKEIRATAAEHLGPWAKPKEIRYVVAIPRTSNGKIRRDDLANLF
jgi:O-succinylbenzoic acid--CoA ligase